MASEKVTKGGKKVIYEGVLGVNDTKDRIKVREERMKCGGRKRIISGGGG
jgi:hypothetical protein